LALSKSDFFRIRKIRIFRAPTLEIPSRLFWRHEIAIFFRFRKFAFSGRQNSQLLQVSFSAITNRFILYTEDSRFQEPIHVTVILAQWKAIFYAFGKFAFQCAKTLQIPSSLFWHHENANSSGLGQFASSERRNTEITSRLF